MSQLALPGLAIAEQPLLGPDGQPVKPQLPAIRPLVAIPSHGMWEAGFGVSLMQMGVWTFASGVGFALKNKRGSILPNLREELLQEAIEMDATHVLFVDADMFFPAETLIQLLQANKEVIGCACCTKQIPSQITAMLDFKKPFPLWDPTMTGVQPVWRVGCGILLIKLTKRIKEMSQPRFPMRWKPDAKCYQGEDWGFCERLAEVGVQMYIDVDLSRQIGHIGNHTYNLQDVQHGR